MDENQYAEFGASHFGSVSRSKLARIHQDAGVSILDVGCGPGLYLRELSQLGREVAGVETNSVLVEQARSVGSQVYQVNLDTDGLTQFDDDSFETVLMLDILEHVESDVRLLKEARRVCRRNVILTVPTRMPKSLEGSQLVFGAYVDPTHRRYYSHRDLLSVLDEAGLKDPYIASGLDFDPVLYNIFPWYFRYPLRFVNRGLKKLSNPQLFTTVWYAVGWKTTPSALDMVRHG
jgi:SAM-dependent methyltransferase